MDERTTSAVANTGDLGNRIAEYLAEGIVFLDQLQMYYTAETNKMYFAQSANDIPAACAANTMREALAQLGRAIRTNGQGR